MNRLMKKADSSKLKPLQELRDRITALGPDPGPESNFCVLGAHGCS